MSAEASYANFFLRLVGSTLEFGLRRQEEVTVHQCQLDQVLGNNEGSFDVGGVNFSQSAKNIQLDGTVLHADLRTSAGIWHPDHLQIIIAIDDTDPTKRSLSVVLRPYTSRLRLLSTRNGPLLLASCGKGEESCVDLGAYLGNRDGAFDPAGQAFHNSAEAITLVGSALHARLRRVDGTWQAYSIGLEDILHLDSSSGLGVLLQPRRQPRRREAHYIVLRDQGQRNWLANARDIFLLNRDDEQRRQWILVAQCGGGHTDGSFFRQTQFYLDDVLGVDYNMIFAPSFLYPQENRGVRAVHLHDGVLTATFNCGGVQDFTRPVWERRSIDLGDMMDNENGSLVLKKKESHSSSDTCAGCRDLFRAGVLYAPRDLHRVPIDFPSLANTKDSCVLCQLMYRTACARASPAAVKELWAEVVQNDMRLAVVVAMSERDQPESIEIRYNVYLDMPSLSSHGLAFELSRARFPDRFRTIPAARFGRSWLDDTQRWSAIEEWVNVCSTQHAVCGGKRPAKLPSRYLHIGSSEGDGIRIATSSKQEYGEYVCLSHCWGGQNDCTLNERTKDEFSKAIPPHHLPPIFYDAIRICRKLGMSRLWIDSLCIQQDSQRDWLAEAQLMGQYYSHCTVCIAATSSPNSHGTMAIQPRPNAIRAPAIDPVRGAFALVAHPTGWRHPDPHFGESPAGPHRSHESTVLAAFPLLTRAWVLQERWLSPRVLHFCGAEVAFECTTTTTCECGRAEAHHAQGRTTGPSESLFHRRRTLAGTSALSHWRYLVATYSAQHLTQASDRPVAFSGIARAVHDDWNTIQAQTGARTSSTTTTTTTTTRYLAGLWQHSLAADLGWFVGWPSLLRMPRLPSWHPAADDDRRDDSAASYYALRPGPMAYLAPSWSWASLLSPVRYIRNTEHLGLELLFQFLDAHVPLAHGDPYGSVAAVCTLYLRGRLFKSRFESRRYEDEVQRLSCILVDAVGSQNLDAPSDLHPLQFLPDHAIHDPLGADFVDPTKESLYVFPISDQENGFFQPGTSRSTSCLVLRRLQQEAEDGPGLVSNVFQRVGFTEYTSPASSGDVPPSHVESLLSSPKEFVLV